MAAPTAFPWRPAQEADADASVTRLMPVRARGAGAQLDEEGRARTRAKGTPEESCATAPRALLVSGSLE
jgi:hypothetical protein